MLPKISKTNQLLAGLVIERGFRLETLETITLQGKDPGFDTSSECCNKYFPTFFGERASGDWKKVRIELDRTINKCATTTRKENSEIFFSAQHREIVVCRSDWLRLYWWFNLSSLYFILPRHKAD